MARAWAEVVTTTVCPTREGEEDQGVIEGEEEERTLPYSFLTGTA